MIVTAALSGADYALLIPLTLASVTTTVVTIIAALRTLPEIKRQVTPPSEPSKAEGGRTLGQITEGTMVNAHAAALDAGRARFAVLNEATGLVAIHGAVGEVKSEVTTGNGQTLGALADIAEGRAAQAIPHADRTAKEQHHADMKVAADATGRPPTDEASPPEAPPQD